jgi:hypothetical protein
MINCVVRLYVQLGHFMFVGGFMCKATGHDPIDAIRYIVDLTETPVANAPSPAAHPG